MAEMCESACVRLSTGKKEQALLKLRIQMNIHEFKKVWIRLPAYDSIAFDGGGECVCGGGNGGVGVSYSIG